MKRIYSPLFAALFFLSSASLSFAQALQAPHQASEVLLATLETEEMAVQLNLNEKQVALVQAFNQQKQERIKALGALREQDRRYLELRVDQIEEQYHRFLYAHLSELQFLTYLDQVAPMLDFQNLDLPQIAEQRH